MLLGSGCRLRTIYYGDLCHPALAIRKKTVKGLCGKMIIKAGMISKLTDHIFPLNQPQLAPVLENKTASTMYSLAGKKKQYTEINRGSWDIWIFFMTLLQTLYDIKYEI